MLGKIAPYVVIGLVQIDVDPAARRLLFDVPIRGSLLELYAASLRVRRAILSLGLLISTLVTDPVPGHADDVLRRSCRRSCCRDSCSLSTACRGPRSWFAELLPLTHFVRIVRGLILRGASLGDLGGELWPLAAFFVVTVSLAIARFRKRLD